MVSILSLLFGLNKTDTWSLLRAKLTPPKKGSLYLRFIWLPGLCVLFDRRLDKCLVRQCPPRSGSQSFRNLDCLFMRFFGCGSLSEATIRLQSDICQAKRPILGTQRCMIA